jgi:hypothetical protein
MIINFKKCTKCYKELEATCEYFNKQARGKYGLGAQCKTCTKKYNKDRWVVVPKKTKKKCNNCKKVFSLTKEFFYTKTVKKGTIVKGYVLNADSTSFRNTCKTCYNKKTYERAQKKIMIKNNLSTSEDLINFKKEKREHSYLKKQKYIYPDNLTKLEKIRYKRIKDMGYNPETYDFDWKKDWYIKNRKYSYPDYEEKVPKSIQQKRISETMPDSFIINRLGFTLEDNVPQDLIELKRKQLKFYRHVKNKKS